MNFTDKGRAEGWSPSLSHRVNKPAGKLSPPHDVNLVCIQKGNGLDVTETNALRVAVTVIAFHCDPFADIEERMPKGTGDDAGSTSDAQIFVDRYPVIILRFPVASLRRTDLHAIGFFAVVAGHGEVKPHVLPLDHFDPGTTWIARPRMEHGAHHFA